VAPFLAATGCVTSANIGLCEVAVNAAIAIRQSVMAFAFDKTI
jgi:hypothetical protein